MCVVLFTWRPYRHFQWCLALTPKCGTKLNQFTFHLHSQLLYSCRLNIVSCSFFLSFPFLPHPHPHHHNSIRLSHSIGSNWSVGCKWWTITIRRIRRKINNLFTIKWTISNTIAFFFYESNGDRGYYCSYLPFALITSDAQSEKRVPLVSLKWLLCQLVSVMHSRLLLYSLATILFGSIHFVSFCTCFIAW